MAKSSSFRKELESAVLERHCANHPMTEKWVRGELGRNALMGWGIEHYHWISNLSNGKQGELPSAPVDVQDSEAENFQEENDPERSHLEIVLRFAEANGANLEEVRAGRGLPTTEAWVAWLNRVTEEESFVAHLAARRVGTESQSPMLYSKVLPALRELYKFSEHDIEHFWLHAEVDIEHGGRGFDLLERHCTTPELQEMAVHYARESARTRWFYFDGIYLHYELDYPLR